MKSIKYLAVLVCMTFVSISLFAQEKTLQTESDGFQWYKLIQGDKKGAQSMGGVTFIPLSRGYTFICYLSGWFSVDKGDKENGVCDITGKEIIAPGRYDSAIYCNEDGFEYVTVKLNGKTGICDMNGREYIAPRYESLIFSADGVFKYEDSFGKWVSTGITPPKANGTTTVTNTVPPTPTPQPQLQPQPQPRPMQVWKPCPYCQGSGKCHVCLGDGHPLTNPTGTCIVCNGRGICSHCAGHGGQNVIEYH